MEGGIWIGDNDGESGLVEEEAEEVEEGATTEKCRRLRKYRCPPGRAKSKKVMAASSSVCGCNL